jgi:energy-coupling factor transport system permease protein
VLGAPLLIAGSIATVVGLRMEGRRSNTTRYRPDPWRRPEWVVAGSGSVALAGVLTAGALDSGLLNPSVLPLTWPGFSTVATAAVMLASVPAWLSPPLPAGDQPIAPARPELEGVM